MKRGWRWMSRERMQLPKEALQIVQENSHSLKFKSQGVEEG